MIRHLVSFLVLGLLVACGAVALGADLPPGPPFGANRYRADIAGTAGEPDFDDYVGHP